MEMNLSQKTYVVTGATSGIGKAVVELLAARGATVIAAGRSANRCDECASMLSRLYPNAVIRYLQADLALQSGVRALAASIRRTVSELGGSHLDGLVNNAGTFTYWFILTPEGIETQWAVNHLAPFLLTNKLLNLLLAAPSARLVTVSSASHYSARINWDDPLLRRNYNGLRAYEQSKLANVLFTAELNRQVGHHANLRAYAADPGLVRTEIGFKGTPALVRWIWSARRSAGISPAESATGIVRLLTSPEIDANKDQIYWKHGLPQQPSRRALDPESGQRLWELSSRMCALAGGA
jgi:NAD(P)-dependent dehydrogenase (short-subunit alcohol dehydrogenase family)